MDAPDSDSAPSEEVSPADYQRLAEVRYQIRRFVRFSEAAARSAGIEPQQHQLLLALKALPEGDNATVGDIAERLQIQHHSAVELVDRLVERGLIRRERAEPDRRQVNLHLTEDGDAILRDLSRHHLAELRSAGPALVTALQALIGGVRIADMGSSSNER